MISHKELDGRKSVALRLHGIGALFTINHWNEKKKDNALAEEVLFYQSMFSKRVRKAS